MLGDGADHGGGNQAFQLILYLQKYSNHEKGIKHMQKKIYSNVYKQLVKMFIYLYVSVR